MNNWLRKDANRISNADDRWLREKNGNRRETSQTTARMYRTQSPHTSRVCFRQYGWLMTHDNISGDTNNSGFIGKRCCAAELISTSGSIATAWAKLGFPLRAGSVYIRRPVSSNKYLSGGCRTRLLGNTWPSNMSPLPGFSVRLHVTRPFLALALLIHYPRLIPLVASYPVCSLQR